MGYTETNTTTGCSSPASSSATSSPSAKRTRDPEDELYIDNLHSHKRYLSEIMASSLNGLTVGDPIPESLLESPARDDIPWQYSPMSEDSDDSRFCDATINPTTTTTTTSTTMISSATVSSSQVQQDIVPPSPASPCRHQKSGPPTRQRSSEASSEGRFPSSPSDICHSADLRRAALLRSVQMRSHSMEATEDRPFIKSVVSSMVVDDEFRDPDCSPGVDRDDNDDEDDHKSPR